MIEHGQKDAEFDAYSRAYDQAVNDSIAFTGLSVDYFTRVKADYLIDLIAGHFGDPRKISVLDVGCGVGNYHKLIVGRLGQVFGVDVSENCIEVAKTHNPQVAYQAYEGQRLPYADASFDAAFTICVMHHVPPAQWTLFTAEMKRVLKPGGMVIVFEHNPLNPLTQRVVSNCVFDKTAVLLPKKATRQLIANAGFHDIIERSIINIPPSGRLLRSLDLALGRMPFGAQYFVKATA